MLTKSACALLAFAFVLSTLTLAGCNSQPASAPPDPVQAQNDLLKSYPSKENKGVKK